MDLKLAFVRERSDRPKLGLAGFTPVSPHHGSQIVKYGADGPAKSISKTFDNVSLFYHDHGNGRVRIDRRCGGHSEDYLPTMNNLPVLTSC
jgi:hypothetical protein